MPVILRTGSVSRSDYQITNRSQQLSNLSFAGTQYRPHLEGNNNSVMQSQLTKSQQNTPLLLHRFVSRNLSLFY